MGEQANGPTSVGSFHPVHPSWHPNHGPLFQIFWTSSTLLYLLCIFLVVYILITISPEAYCARNSNACFHFQSLTFPGSTSELSPHTLLYSILSFPKQLIHPLGTLKLSSSNFLAMHCAFS